MCKVLVTSVKDGLIPSERVVRIESVTGATEELSLSARQVFDNKLISASEIIRQSDRVLVELPRETASGRWRIWVDAKLIVV
jgi:hypothetical protein